MESNKFLIVLVLVCSVWGLPSDKNPCQGHINLTYIPDTEACEKYIICKNEKPLRHMACQTGKWFSATRKDCFPKEEVDCRFNDPKTLTTDGRAADEVSVETVPSTTSTTATTTTTTTTTSTTTTMTTTTTTTSTEITSSTTPVTTTTTTLTSTTTQSVISAEISCPATNPRDVHFVASPKDCGIYYLCYNGDPVLLKCSSGMHWNSAAKMCDTPKNANCKIETSTPSRFDCPNTGLVFIPHSVNCNWYFFCNEGIPLLQQCPFLHYFDVDKRRCVLRFLARCALAVRRERI